MDEIRMSRPLVKVKVSLRWKGILNTDCAMFPPDSNQEAIPIYALKNSKNIN